MEKTIKNPWTVLLSDGGVRSLIASCKYTKQYRLLSLYVHDGRVVDSLSLEAVNKQAEHYEIKKTFELLMPHLNGPPAKEGAQNPHPLRWQQLLMAAGYACTVHHAKRLIWPIQIGPDVERMSTVTETILLVQQIIRLETSRLLTIETPFLDLTDRQMIEVGHQMDVPWEISRSCQEASDGACETCMSCRRRRDGFLAAGVNDPLMSISHA